ncbi:DUF3099 domain-containing protein [Catellatospora coxensis]|uniref:DUF3099 family protein n=1 Tax=Catellatospora coxensis TaxID=310354 RepID=A0A8J3L697_9ACTN|nr:DUF3099 domain-containing protein [Catellatospora coxensis]GIG08650.1 hypothetical protein Cco03nite_53500 [Catellatospora coxensis]
MLTRRHAELITDAPASPQQELRHRERRYVAMMLLRAACLLAAGVLAIAEAPLLWLWLPLCGLGMVLLPWLAVILANDGPPKPQHRWRLRTPALIPAQALPRTAEQTIDADTAA